MKITLLKKITDAILDKNRKVYSGGRCALIIDVTNLVAIQSSKGSSLKELFRNKKFKGFSDFEKKIKFGIIILCNSVYKYRTDGTMYNSLNPYIGIMSENENIDPHLNSFVRAVFNDFKPCNDYEQSFYHEHI